MKDVPALKASENSFTIDQEGGDISFIVESTRKWAIAIESSDASDWFRIDPESRTGENTQTVTITARKNTQGPRTLTLIITTATLKEQVIVRQRGVYEVEDIYADDFGNGVSESPWPSVTDYTGWNKSGTGAA
ncbi:MAG: hypothetical protein LBF90_02085, partial [Prevotellaceae bacterium]|nr:hypothetical protein [Prevotellaceae bacterium]